MQIEKMSKEAEKRIVTALETAISLTNSGSDPNEAIRKVAEDCSFTPPIIRRMVEAYNTSRTLAHLKKASGEDRATTFPLADPAVILGTMYPEKVSVGQKAAEYVPSDYARKPGDFMSKVAEARHRPIPRLKYAQYERDALSHERRVWGEREKLEKVASSCRSELRICLERMRTQIKEAAAYFKNLYRDPFAQIESRLVGQYGALAVPVMTAVYKTAGLKEARCSGPQRQLMADFSQAPYNTLVQLMTLAKEAQTLAHKTLEAEDSKNDFLFKHRMNKVAEVEVSEERLLDGALVDPFHRPFEENPLLPFDKAAMSEFFSPDTAGSVASSVLGLRDSGEGKSKPELAFDPKQDLQLRGIHTKVMLNDLLSNDPIIGSYPPNEVASAFNQLSQLSPAVAQQPAVARAMLRRMLQSENVVEPHEAAQLADLNEKLQRPSGVTNLFSSQG